ncbi:zona pellucida protein C isoform 1-T1 [Syngnathus typhle]
MRVLELLLFVFLSHLSLVHLTEAVFLQNIFPFPYQLSDDFNSIFNPRRARDDFGTFADLSSITKAVQVYCDESELILLVNKRLGDVILNRDEIQLGDGCYSNSELASQLIFTYRYDQCGTRHEMEKGLDVFSNFLHFSPRKVFNSRLTPSTVHISCIPNRSNEPNLPYQTFLDKSRQFSIQAMDSSWTSAAESNIYIRGQIINIQLSAKLRPHQQLFIRSCFISSSPESRIKPWSAVIMNKGCTVPSSSSYPLVKFLDSDYSQVKFALNSTSLISEMYIHCSVLISDIGITSGSKSCNFDLVNSRWEELSGNVEVCRCCNSKCEGLSVKHLSQDAKAVVSTGPIILVQRPAPSIQKPDLNLMQSDAAPPEEESISVSSEFQWPSSPGAIVVVKQDPVSSLTLLLPGRNEQSDPARDGTLIDLQIPTMELETKLNDTKGQIANVARGKPLRMEVRDELWHDYKATKRQERPNDAQPILRSKIQLSKKADGSQTLSYEEAVVEQDKGSLGTFGMDEPPCKRKGARRRLRSIFLDLLRKMNKVE